MFNILRFIEAATTYQSTALNLSVNLIILLSRLFAFALIVCSRAISTGTPANDFLVIMKLKPPQVKIFCRSSLLASKLAKSKGIQGHPTSIVLVDCHGKYGCHFKKQK